MRIVLFLFLLLGLFQAEAQVVEVNPNIHWNYIRTQNLELQSGRTYQFEVPAEKGYDYVFNLTHSQTNAFARINIVDMQYGPVSSIVDSSSNVSLDLNFRVQDNGTYIVVIVVSTHRADVLLPSVLSLVRRPIVEY